MNILLRLKERAKSVSRNRKDEHFYSLCNKECPILDVGVSSESKKSINNISKNHFLKSFKYEPKFYTGLGIDSYLGMDLLYPGKKFVQYNGAEFPFKDKEFTWSYSNAVIEHVGDYNSKLKFLKEMIRVSENVFCTTPNKFFPVDAHTMSFFIHWNDRLFLAWRKWKQTWLPKEKLNLLSKKEIKKLLKDACVKNYTIKKNKFFGLNMTFTIIITS